MTLQNFIKSPYNLEYFKDFIKKAFPQAQLLNSQPQPYNDKSSQNIIRSYTPICQDIELESSNILQVFAFEVGSTHAKITLHKELAKIAKNNASHILACFYDPSDTTEFRLSLITTGFDFEANKTTHSNLRRQSFVLGSSTPTHTAQKQLKALIDSTNKDKQALESAFSLEPVTKEFYKEIVGILINLIDSIQLPLEAHDSTTAESRDDKNSSDNTKREFSLRLISRLLFCKFLEKKGLINQAIFSTTLSDSYYHEVLEPLFFSTLNTPKDARDYSLLDPRVATLLDSIPYLNGGLFAAQKSDYYSPQKPTAYHTTLKVPNAPLQELFTLLEHYHFSIDESTPNSQEVGLNPELLGMVFESLLSELFTDNRKDSTSSLRKSTGSYYTPRVIVQYMCRSSLYQYLLTKLDSAFGDRVGFLAKNGDCGGESALITTQGKSLDSPCKAPFLSPKSCRERTALESTSDNKTAKQQSSLRGEATEAIHSLIFHRDPTTLTQLQKSQILHALSTLKVIDPACGSGAFPIGLLQELLELGEILGDTRDTYTRKLEILQNNIYGVDIQPMATEISRLRCFLSLILEEDANIAPLPNLEFKFLSANSLLPLPTDSTLEYDGYQADRLALESIRRDTFNAALEDKESLKQRYLETTARIAKNLIQLAQGENPLTLWNPYDPHSVAGFFDSEYMFGLQGFDIVIGNPPYIRQEKIPQKQEILQAFSTYKLYPDSNPYKFSNGTADIYTYFYAKGLQSLAHNGILSFITSNKYCRAGYGANLRATLLESTILDYVELNGIKAFDNAIVDTSIITLAKSKPPHSHTLSYKPPRESQITPTLEGKPIAIPQASLSQDSFTFPQSELEHKIKAKIEAIGTPLKEWDISINYGIKTGYNEAFIIDSNRREEILNNCKDKSERERTSKLIKKMLRGRDIKRYSYEWAGLWLINTHNGYQDSKGNKIPPIDIKDYPTLKAYLDTYEPNLSKRSDKGVTPYNLRNCAYLEEFEKEKIVYPNMAKEFIAHLDTQGFFTNQKCFILTDKNGENLHYLTAILNSKANFWYFKQIGATLGASGYEMSKIFVEKLPIPKAPNPKLLATIEQKVCEILESKKQTKSPAQSRAEKELDSLIYQLYDLDKVEIDLIESSFQERERETCDS